MPDDRVLAGKYRLIAKLSKGGMGSVWRAQHLELDCPAAVKLLDSAFADSAEALARFKREAQSAASLRSAHIVQIFDFGVDNGTPYIAMELLRGQSLADLLAERSPLQPEEVALILSQVARAVAWAHSRGIIHRDLKPGNIFISEDASESVVKLVDFGIAKPAVSHSRQAPVTMTGAIMGTPQYMSPEQASGRGVVDHRTDIWSFGIVAFECLTGYHAFAAETLASLLLAICTDPLPIPSEMGVVPAGFDEWFAHCAQRNPNERFSSIAQAAEELRQLCGVVTESRLRVIPRALPETLCSNSSQSAPLESTPAAHATTHSASIMSLVASGGPRRSRPYYLALAGLLGTGAILAAIWIAFNAQREPLPEHALAQATGALPTQTPSSQVAPTASSPAENGNSGSPIVLLARDRTQNEPSAEAKKVVATPPTAGKHQVTRSRAAERAPATSSVSSAEVQAAVPLVASAKPIAEETVESEFGFNKASKQRGKH